MNTALIGELIKLRYKLLWPRRARVMDESRCFWWVTCCRGHGDRLLTSGGLWRGHGRGHIGKAEQVAPGVLDGAVSGGGLRSAYSGSASVPSSPTGTAALSADRAGPPHHAPSYRHRRSLLVSILALQLGLTVGLYVVGSGRFWLASLRFCCSSSPIICSLAWWARRSPTGAAQGWRALLLGLVMSLAILPGLAGLVQKNPAIGAAVVRRLRTRHRSAPLPR